MRKSLIARFSQLTILATIALCSQGSFAHSEDEKVRFVASNGIDQGDCKNRFRPCASITYALQQADKGDKVLVAQGSYDVTQNEDLLYLISDLHPILGGFNTLDNYQVQQPSQFKSVLVGVPAEYRQQLYDKGFHVIADIKGIESEKLKQSLSAIELMSNSQAASTCTNGDSAGFECSNLSLLSHVPISQLPTGSSRANDIWGHVDLNTMNEYAIIGLQRGIAVLDVTDPENPEVIGSVTGQSTTWRDIKVYQYYSSSERRWRAYAYSSADSVTEGLTVIDLSGLPESISLVGRTLDDLSSHNVYISNVDYTTNTALPGRSALLHVLGSDNFGGSWRSFDLKNPSAPAASYELNSATRANDYTHDASSVLISDERAQRDCVHAGSGPCNVIIDFNENELRLWDHSSSTQSTELGRGNYPNAQYVHSGWWSEDKQYVILHDELDERGFGINTTVHFFDISDLNNPFLVSSWVGPTRAVDHNGFTRGSKYYMSNYERGVTVLDISDPLVPVESGFFDTYPSSNNSGFNGTWGVYPYLPSGVILASDIQGGLYVLRDDTLSASDNAVAFAQTDISFNEGDSGSIQVNKQGNGAMSVDYHALFGSAGNADFQVDTGTLTWSANDTAPKSIPVSITLDTSDELDEIFFVRLSNPSNGNLDIQGTTAFVTIEGTGVMRGVVSFVDSALTVKEIDGTVTIPVSRSGGTDEAISVNYQVTANSAEANNDFQGSAGTLQWADSDSEDKFISVDIVNDDTSEDLETFSISLSASESELLSEANSIEVSIRDDESNLAPVVDAGNDFQVNTRQSVTLNATASDEDQNLAISWEQTSGITVTLSDSNGLTPSFTAPTSATRLVFQLTATDEFGVNASASVTVTVNAPATPTTQPTSSGSSGGSLPISLIIGISVLILLRRKDSNKA